MSPRAAQPAQATAQQQPQKRERMSLRTLIILLVIFLLEALVIVAAFMLAAGPRAVQGEGAKPDDEAMLDRPREILVIEDRFENNEWGRSYQFDVRIVALVKTRNLDLAEERIDTAEAQVANDVRTIIAQAEPAQLLEASKQSIKRQVHQKLDKRLGLDDSGDPIVEEVMIPRWVRFRSDF